MRNAAMVLTLGLVGLTGSACSAPIDTSEEDSGVPAWGGATGEELSKDTATAEPLSEDASAGDAIASKEQAIFGSNSCKDPKIDIFNPGSVSMRVKALKFFDQTSDKWRSEDIANTTIPPDSGMRFRDNLDNAKNHRIGSWKVKLDDNSWQKVTINPSSSEGTVLDGFGRKCVSKAGTRYALELNNPIRTKIIKN
jgi:hypothetical protein